MDTPISAKMAILQVLVRGPEYGLKIIDKVKEHSGGRISLHQGSLYPALRSLEADGLIESYPGETTPERGGRPRYYYKLTAEGARAATEQRDAVVGLLGLPLPEGW